MNVEDIEKRFLEVSGILCDLTKFPLSESDIKNNIKVDKQKSNQYGEVFTPLWLVDQMILKSTIEKLYQSNSTLDLCAGWGQFTIRMIRALANYDKNFDVNKWLIENHTFIEMQLESSYKLLYIFGVDINLLIGDALEIKKVKKWDGVNYFDGYWRIVKKQWIIENMVNKEDQFVDNFIELIKHHKRKDETLIV